MVKVGDKIKAIVDSPQYAGEIKAGVILTVLEILKNGRSFAVKEYPQYSFTRDLSIFNQCFKFAGPKKKFFK